MKKSIYLFVCLILFTTTNIFAEIWTVGIGNVHDFSTLQSAHDDENVNAGDTILVHQGGSYGPCVFTKQLSVFGPGYFLDENEGVQANTLPANCENLTIHATAEGTYLSGLGGGDYINAYAENIVIERCNYHTVNINKSNIVIRQSYLRKLHFSGGVCTGIIVNNNIFTHGGGNNFETITNSIGSNMQVEFINNTFTWQVKNVAQNSIFKNNIFLSANSSGNLTTANNGNIITNNVFAYNTSSEVASNNTTGVSYVGNVLFAGYPSQDEHSTDGLWQLSSNSHAIGVGENGIDCGAYGGDDSYKLSGPGRIPRIAELTAPKKVSNVMNIIIKLKAE